MAFIGDRSVRSELHRLARSIPRPEDDSRPQLSRQRLSRKHYGFGRYRTSSRAPVTSKADKPSRNIAQNRATEDADTVHDPQTQALSCHSRLESDSSGQNDSTPSSEKSMDLNRFNLRHGWNAYYGMPQSAVNATSAPTMVGKNGRNTDHRKERARGRHDPVKVARVTTEHGGKHVTFTPPSVSSDKQYRFDEKHISNASTREVRPDPYRERDTWRGDRGIRQLDDNRRSDLKETHRIKRRNWCIAAAMLLLMLGIAIPIAVVLSGRERSPRTKSPDSSEPSNDNLHNVSHSSIPKWARGGYLDPFDWYDTLDFNVTFTDAKVGGLYIMGLNDTWDDSTRANDNVPALDEKWQYGSLPFRGVNLGGWLSIEPFITPSLFMGYLPEEAIVDEWSLSEHLGPAQAKHVLEQHYSQWVRESTFAEVQAAGFDHVRIPFSYWAVDTYTDDPYVPMISFRYLLRGIEWARKYGLHIYLDLHGAPGSQNGWNHSGHQGLIGWMNGTEGGQNAQRTIDIHQQLATFFAQPRYQNIIAMYGLVNEPKMSALPQDKVLDWNHNAIETIRGTGYSGLLVMGDGLLGLESWHGKMQGYEGLVLDAHQYAIYSLGLLSLNHYDKVNFACGGWTQQSKNSINTATGFGPTMVGEFSQADTDCAMYLNGVGVGSRWDGTLDAANRPGDPATGTVTTPECAADTKSMCSCKKTYADPSTYSNEYKKWLLTFAEAQMHSFEYSWGWFYWTWKTESAPQWSYKDGLAAGILPKKAYERSWNCSMPIPDFSGQGLLEWY